MSFENLYDYYQAQEVLPTYSSFKTPADLAAHLAHRHDLFLNKLYLPPRLFQGANLLEFGPDTGENALVFARWGANCTLVEPNPKAHAFIQEYFEREGLTDKLVALSGADMQSFTAEKPYDFIIAEGFIYTIQPHRLWIEPLQRLLASQGFVVMFYYEKFSCFFELFLKVLHHWLKRHAKLDPIQSAKKLYQTKWDSIPHRRPMEAWVMDVLENPFVRLPYFFVPEDLCAELYEAGLDLYSATPAYQDGLQIDWFKRAIPREEKLRRNTEFIRRSRLSHMFGRSLFQTAFDPQFDSLLSDLLAHTDRLIDNSTAEDLRAMARILQVVRQKLASPGIMTTEEHRQHSLATVDSLQQIIGFLQAGQAEELITFCNSDPHFIQTWGNPSQFGVFVNNQ